MSDTNDAFARSVALDKALAFWGEGAAKQPALVLETAEAFRKFLAGESTEEPEAEKESYTPSWVYFRYRHSKNIYYRSDTSKPDTELGNLQRKGYFDQGWRAVQSGVGNPQTRSELRDRNAEYVWVPRSQVPPAYL